MVKEMKPRHEITPEYNFNPRHQKRWEQTIEWLKQFDIKGQCLDCGGNGGVSTSGIILSQALRIGMSFTSHNLDERAGWHKDKKMLFDCVFVFEVIEHLLNPLVFLKDLLFITDIVYLSTPINRPKFMRNKEYHFHEFNYNELVYLIDKSGFKIVDEKRINCTTWKMITGFRPLLRFFGIDKNILLRLKRK